MIENIANLTYDWDNIKNISQDSNLVKICTYDLILNICVAKNENYINISIFNNTGQDLYNLSIYDFNNNYIYEQKTINKNDAINVKYKKKEDPKLLICYMEKVENQSNIVYVRK